MLDSNQVKNKLSQDDIIKLCCYLQGSDEMLWDSYHNPIFNTVLDHKDGKSLKLYYFHETKLFRVFTRGESYDVFELVKRALDLETFKESFDYIVNFFHLKTTGFDDDSSVELTSDWDIFQKVQDYSTEPSVAPAIIKPIQENLLEYFYPLAAPVEWLQDGISALVMRYYGIRVDTALQKIIIPHRNIDGELIGIRGRSYDQKELDDGKKYMPVFIEGDMYNHPLGKNLFGLYDNKQVIKNIKKVFVAESEKSVMQLATMYGVDNCWAVATCGSSFSRDQMNLLLALGVEEIILGYDREFEGHKGDQDTMEYEQKLLKVVAPLLPYVNVSVIMDYDHLLPKAKMSPTDAGKEIFEQLYHSRVRLYSYNEKLHSRRKGK